MFSDNMKFKDRIQAGRQLGERLLHRAFLEPVILALPRGGVPVAEEVARILGAPLDVVIARKIGAPGQEEFGIGAISEDEVPHFNPSILNNFNITGDEVRSIVKAEIQELRRRIVRYREGRDLPNIEGKTVILVDDGLATGVTATAAGAFLESHKPQSLILAAPVCPHTISSEVREQFDEIICLHSPRNFRAVALWYEEFDQVEDDEVMFILNRHHVDTKKLRNEFKPNLNRLI